jgi:ankyrin repeat protein
MDTKQEISQELINEFVGAAHGDFDRVKALLAEYPNLINSNAVWVETPIEAAAQMGRRDIVEFLLSAGAPLEICTAAMMGMADKVESMLQGDPPLKDAKGAHGLPLMYFPAVVGDTRIAEIVLAHGADINTGSGGNTALHAAVLFGQPDMARWLLEHGADPNALDYEQKTPEQVATEKGHPEVAEVIRRYTN